MKNRSCRLIALVVMAVLCVFTTGAMAEAVQPDGAWIAEHLQTVLPTMNGDVVKTLALNELSITGDAAETLITAQPALQLRNDSWCNVSLDLVQQEDGTWVLDDTTQNKLAYRLAKPSVKDNASLPHPTVEDIEAVASIQGICGPHGLTELSFAETVHSVSAYQKDGKVHALVTLTPSDVAAAAQAKLGEKHRAGQVNQLKVTYHVAQVEGTWTLKSIDVCFVILCGGDIPHVYYSDGVDDEVIFPTYVLTVDIGQPTPEFPGETPARAGWQFDGWKPEVSLRVSGDTYYSAKWIKIHTITYDDGVADEEIFPTETYQVLDGEPTPVCTVDVSDPHALREGWVFKGWSPVVTDKATQDVTYVAQWAHKWKVTYFDWYDQKVLAEYIVEDGQPTPYEDYTKYTKGSYVNLGWTKGHGPIDVLAVDPYVTQDVTYVMMQMVPPRNSNVVGLGIHFDCSVENLHDNDTWFSWFSASTYMLDGEGAVSYDAAKDQYVATVKIKDDLTKLLTAYGRKVGSNNKPVPHELVSISDKSFTCTFNMDRKNWTSDLAAITVSVKCAEAPCITEKTDASIQKAKFRAIDQTGKKGLYGKTLIAGTYSVSAIRGGRAEGGWYFDVTITDYAPYVALYQEKHGANYRLDADKTGTLTYTFKYAYNTKYGTTPVLTDGTGWSWDTTGLSNNDKWNGLPIYLQETATVTYTDGVEDAEIFPDQTYTADVGAATPAFVGEITREGHSFLGWSPEVAETVTGDATYTATWDETYTITYENVPETAVNPNPTSYVRPGEAIALQPLTLDEKNYGFLGWVDEDGNEITEIGADATGNLVIKAVISPRPEYPNVGRNLCKNFYRVQCTTVAEHGLVHDAFVDVNTSRPTNNDLAWNAEAKRWEITVGIGLSFVNTSVTCQRDFGNTKHYWYDADGNESAQYKPKVRMYFVADSAESKTGTWYPVAGTPVTLNVYCYDKPGEPKEQKVEALSGKLFWFRNWANLTQNKRQNKFLPGTYTLGEMTGNDKDGWKVPVTITNMDAYLNASGFPVAYPEVNVYDAIHSATVPTLYLKYPAPKAGSRKDLKQDGSGWSLDYTGWSNADKMNGLPIYYYQQWTTTYQDGVDGAAFETQTIVYPETTEDITTDYLRKVGPYKTPAFDGEPTREGYIFAGWEPEVSEDLTENVTYTAKWTKSYTVTYTDGVEDEAIFEDQVSTVAENEPTPAYEGEEPTREGYVFIGWAPEVAETVTADVTYVAQWEALCAVYYWDGVDEEEIFSPQLYTGLRQGSDTPKFLGTPQREGYEFAGWDPEWSDKVTGDVTYAAVWKKWVTVTFKDGTEENNVLSEEKYLEGAELVLPAEPEREGYVFKGWNPAITVAPAEDTVIEAVWAKLCTITFIDWYHADTVIATVTVPEGDPMPKVDMSGVKMLKDPAIAGWYPALPDTVTKDATYKYVQMFEPRSLNCHASNISFDFVDTNEPAHSRELKSGFAWSQVFTDICEGKPVVDKDSYTATVVFKEDKSEMEANLASAFGSGAKKYPHTITSYSQNSLTFYLDLDTIATNKKVTKLWEIAPTTITISGVCPNAPVVNDMTKSAVIENVKIYMQDTKASSKQITNKKILPGTYTVGEMTGSKEEGGWKFDVTITDFAAYEPLFQEKYGAEYRQDADANEPIVVTFTYPYTGASTRILADGTGWKKSAPYRITIKFDKYCNITYTDGVEDEEVFADKILLGKLNANTPAFGDEPTRAGYRFLGWTPEVAETVTGDATYAATWQKTYTVTYTDGVEDETVFADQVYMVDENAPTPAFNGEEPTREGYAFAGWTPAEVPETVTADITFTATWTKVHTITYTDGVADAEVFADQVYHVKDGEKTPAYEGPAFVRAGYSFTGWTPELQEMATADVTYVATWQELDPGRPSTEPVEPTEPETPAEPTEPEAPAEPTEPETPAEPTEPETPAEPTEPETPAEPTEPEAPVEPTEPETPAEPTEPETPVEPTEPETPAEPTEPETPVETENPIVASESDLNP